MIFVHTIHQNYKNVLTKLFFQSPILILFLFAGTNAKLIFLIDHLNNWQVSQTRLWCYYQTSPWSEYCILKESVEISSIVLVYCSSCSCGYCWFQHVKVTGSNLCLRQNRFLLLFVPASFEWLNCAVAFRGVFVRWSLRNPQCCVASSK
jgi:hypothetical protein